MPHLQLQAGPSRSNVAPVAEILPVLLHHQAEKPFSPPPFRFAIFLSSIYPYSASVQLGRDVTEEARPEERPKRPPSFDSAYSSEEDIAKYTVRVFKADCVKAKIQMPTAHIYGTEDSVLHECRELVKMCDKSVTFTYEHNGEHVIPMDADTNKAIRDVIMMAVERSDMLS